VAKPDGVVNVNGGVARGVAGCGGGVVVVAVSPSVAEGSDMIVPVPWRFWATPTLKAAIIMKAAAPVMADNFLNCCDRNMSTPDQIKEGNARVSLIYF
jgi:hypothetical protein